MKKCENVWKSAQKAWKSAETILPFSCCPSALLWSLNECGPGFWFGLVQLQFGCRAVQAIPDVGLDSSCAKEILCPPLTCFHASFFPFCPLCWSPLFLPSSRHLFRPFLPQRMLCSVEQGTQHRAWKGAVSGWTFHADFGKEIPSRNLREKRSVQVTSTRRVGPVGFRLECRSLKTHPAVPVLVPVPVKQFLLLWFPVPGLFLGHPMKMHVWLLFGGEKQPITINNISRFSWERVDVLPYSLGKQGNTKTKNFQEFSGKCRDSPGTVPGLLFWDCFVYVFLVYFFWSYLMWCFAHIGLGSFWLPKRLKPCRPWGSQLLGYAKQCGGWASREVIMVDGWVLLHSYHYTKNHYRTELDYVWIIFGTTRAKIITLHNVIVSN